MARIVAFGKLAEIAAGYLRTGSLFYIEGSFQTRKWPDQSEQGWYVPEVIVNADRKLQILISAENSDGLPCRNKILKIALRQAMIHYRNPIGVSF